MLRSIKASVRAGWVVSFSLLVALAIVTTAAQAMPGALPPTVDTGLRSPSAQAADTGGDRNGFETLPTYAHANDGKYAVDANSGTNGSTSCTDAGKDRHRFYNYSFSIPAGSVITGIAVQLVAKVDHTANAPKMCAQLSWDGGKTWTATQMTTLLSTSQATYTLGGATDLWGRSTWSAGHFSNANFRLRIINVASATNRTFLLDSAGVRVFYSAPTSTSTATRPSATPTRTRTVTKTQPSATVTRTNTSTQTATSTQTETPLPPTETFTPTSTETVAPTETETETPTETPTLIPTATYPAPGWAVAWGYGLSGQTNVPVGLSDVTALAGGLFHSLALKSDGTVVAWGTNSYGQATVPADLTQVTDIAAGAESSLALKSDGTVVVWGNLNQAPAGLDSVVAIAAGGDHALALRNDGTVVAWGSLVSIPSGLTGVTAIAAGGFHSLALKNDGTVVAWGDNTYGQATVPADLTGVTAIAAGGFHSLALKNDGTVVAWGDNSFGGESTVPMGLSGVTSIVAGKEHSLALKSDGTVVAWGNNTYGQSTVPVWLNGVTAIAAGEFHSLALVGSPVTPTPTITTTPTRTLTRTSTTTATRTLTSTPTPSPTRTSTSTTTVTATPSPTRTGTSTTTVTATATPSATLLPPPTDTETPLPSGTVTAWPTDTETPPPSDTPLPTDTETPMPTATPDCQPTWEVMANPQVGLGDNALSMLSAISADDIWAVGTTNASSAASQMLIEHWDGTSWTVAPNPVISTTRSLLYGVAALAANDVWAVGAYAVNNIDQTLTLHWDGTSWQVVPSPNVSPDWNEALGQVAAISANDVWAVGNLAISDGHWGYLMMHWDGLQWTGVAGPGLPANKGVAITGLAAASANDVWAAGGYMDTDYAAQPLIFHWDGTSWASPARPSTGLLTQVDARSANDAWAIGVGNAPAGGSTTLIWHWDGAAWSSVSSPSPAGVPAGLTALRGFSSDDVWAAGTTAGNYPAQSVFVEHWNGVNWSPVDLPAPINGQLTGLASISRGEVWGVGWYYTGMNVQQPLIMRGQCR
jgi:hypothetical protein